MPFIRKDNMISLFNILPAMIHNWPDAVYSCVNKAEEMEKDVVETQKKNKQKVRTRRVQILLNGTTMPVNFFIVSTQLIALMSRVVCDHVYLECPTLRILRWGLNAEVNIFSL